MINPTNQKQQLLLKDSHQQVHCLNHSHTSSPARVDSVEALCFLSLIHYKNVLGDGSVTLLLNDCMAHMSPGFCSQHCQTNTKQTKHQEWSHLRPSIFQTGLALENFSQVLVFSWLTSAMANKAFISEISQLLEFHKETERSVGGKAAHDMAKRETQ